MDILQYDFMINALMTCLLASVALGIVGTYVVVKRIVFISGGISHTAYGGIGLGYLAGFNPIYGALGFTLLSSLFISSMRKTKSQYEDTLIGILWAFGMALGILFINFHEGYTPDLMSYLFGNILAVSNTDIIIMLILDGLILGTVILLFNEFQAITFDEEYSEASGLPAGKLYLLLLIIISFTAVLLIKLVGIILVVALLSIPGAISINYVKSLKGMMFFSTILGVIFTVGGLLLSYYLDISSGATIILVAAFFYGVSHLYLKIRLSSNS
jgi:zinc transport system permease protein